MNAPATDAERSEITACRELLGIEIVEQEVLDNRSG